MSYYCEMCGRELEAREAKRAIVEGSPLILCPSCYQRVSKQTVTREVQSIQKQKVKTIPQPQQAKQSTKRMEEFELVEDYATRIKRGRERLGWSQEILAMKVGESVNTIKRIEMGKLRPSIPLAMKIEKVLGIKLLEPVVDEVDREASTGSRGDYATIGDLIKISEQPSGKKP